MLCVRVQRGTVKQEQPNCFQKAGKYELLFNPILSNVYHDNYRKSRLDTFTHFDVSFDCISNLGFLFLYKFKSPRP